VPHDSLIDILDKHAADIPDQPAFIFLSNRDAPETKLTFAGLRVRALAIANELQVRGAQPGERAALVFPAGLDFIAAFFGCLAAGVIAIPLSPPRRVPGRDAVANIISDCAPRFALTTPQYAADLSGGGPASLRTFDNRWLLVTDDLGLSASETTVQHRPASEHIAFLQYTSGSTSAPKGVMVTNANLISNLEMIRHAMGHSRTSTHVCWMPLHHDMGLILNVLETFYLGATCALMAPVSFLQRPLSWLRAIHQFGAEAAGGPNFGFDLCVAKFRPEAMIGVDLSRWRVAFNGAEPVRAQTIRRFAETFEPYGFDPAAFYPCYGMAEATLLISGGGRHSGAVTRSVSRTAMHTDRIEAPTDASDEQAVVGCGRALVGENIAIVDPEECRRLPYDHVGEIWVRGNHVAGGYWQNEEASRHTFAAAMVEERGAGWLRTGDLGFMDARGELFVTGRIKDLIIVRGANHYPQDIENTAQATSPCLRAGHGAAFSIVNAAGEERVVIVQEIERSYRHRLDFDEIAGAIREAIAEEHGLSVAEVVLVRPGAVPKTTSGKIQRRLTHALWLDGQVATLSNTGRTPRRTAVLSQP
jgi:acyl-CoA synthetase (AMP-forming)/AMP-acid ligase II